MDLLSFLRMMGSLAVVLGLLAGALWLVRRYELRLPQNIIAGFAGRSGPRRMELIERLSLDPRRSITLIRLDDREYMVLIAPEGVLRLDAQAAGSGLASGASAASPATTPDDATSPAPCLAAKPSLAAKKGSKNA